MADKVDTGAGACGDKGLERELTDARGGADEDGHVGSGGGGVEEGVGGEDFGLRDHLEGFDRLQLLGVCCEFLSRGREELLRR